MNYSNKSSKTIVGIPIATSCGHFESIRLDEIKYGLEEEQVPYQIKEFLSQDNPVYSAHQVAADSIFGVGISCLRNGIVLHLHNFLQERPLFYLSDQNCNLKNARIIGLNAARIIKKKPLVLINDNC